MDEFAPLQGPLKKWMPELDVVQRVVTSELNPLEVRRCVLSAVHVLTSSTMTGLLVKRRHAVRARRPRHGLRLLTTGGLSC